MVANNGLKFIFVRYEEDGDTTGDSDALSCGHARAESGAAAFA